MEGTNWKGDKFAYTYNGLGVRINNTHTTHSGSVYDRDYVIDYTSLERDDLMVYAEGNGQLEYVQREVYAGSERIEQFTDRSRGGYERLLYVHEDLQGNTRYYTKTTGQSFAELTYDAWGMPESPNKLLNNDHGNYVYATYTGHIFDTTLDIYFCEARFYDASTRTWMAMDPVKDGGNWYQYCYGNPLKYWDPLGMSGFKVFGCQISEDGTVEVNKLEFSLEMIRTFLPMVLRETITGKQGSFDIGKDLAAMMGGLSGHVLKFLGEAFIGLGNGFKYWSPYVTSLGLMSTIFGSGPGAGLALAIPGIGILTSAAMVTGGLALTAIGLTSDVLGTILMSMGTEMSSMGDRKISQEQKAQESSGNPREALNDKISVVNGSRSEARHLSRDEKILANQILDDINDYVYYEDRDAYQRLIDKGLHTLQRDYAGWESVYVDPDGSRGISNTVRILFKQTPNGVEWMVKIFH